MGLFGAVQKQFIKRPDNAKEQIVYKWPYENIRMLSQLTVQPDEKALFVKEGVVKGILGEGMHTLDGANLPFIGGLVDVTTGNNYLVSELYFVSIKEFVNQLFGGPIDNVLDPQTNLAIGLRVYGEYAMQAIDPEALVLKLVGTTNISSQDAISEWVASQLLKVIREAVVKHVTGENEQEQWDILGIAARNDAVEQESVSEVNPILAVYGLEVTRLGNINISIKDEDAETLKQLKRDTVYGGNMAAADAALKLGAAKGFQSGNMNPGLFAAGLGFGLDTANSTLRETQCPSCKAQIPQGSLFCPTCGTKLSV